RRRPLLFVAALAPFIVAVGAINARMYESALVSGYGTLNELYSWSYWPANLRQFTTWTIDTQTPVVALAALFLFAPRLFPPTCVPHPRFLVIAFGAAVKLSYLFYRPFDAWWYLRFLLPVWPIMMVFTVAAFDPIAARFKRPMGATVMIPVALLAA